MSIYLKRFSKIKPRNPDGTSKTQIWVKKFRTGSPSDNTDKYQFHLGNLLNYCDYIVASVVFEKSTLKVKITEMTQ